MYKIWKICKIKARNVKIFCYHNNLFTTNWGMLMTLGMCMYVIDNLKITWSNVGVKSYRLNQNLVTVVTSESRYLIELGIYVCNTILG